MGKVLFTKTSNLNRIMSVSESNLNEEFFLEVEMEQINIICSF